MASYRLLIKPSAVKDIETLPKKNRRRLVAKIQTFTGNPRPQGCEKLSGHELYRLRQGNYRILYAIQDVDLVIVVIKVGHPREVYR